MADGREQRGNFSILSGVAEVGIAARVGLQKTAYRCKSLSSHRISGQKWEVCEEPGMSGADARRCSEPAG
jgi:hypothetical protein